MSKNSYGNDDCPMCLLMRKAYEINGISLDTLAQKPSGFRRIGDILKENGQV